MADDIGNDLQISPETKRRHIQRISAAFDVFDGSQNKTCDPREVGTIIRSLGIYPSEEQLANILKEMEEDEPTGYIHFNKFCNVVLKMIVNNSYQRDSEERLYRAFQTLDVEQKGYLTPDELRHFMTTEGEVFSNEEIQEMLAACVDPADSGKIYYEEFVTVLAQRT